MPINFDLRNWEYAKLSAMLSIAVEAVENNTTDPQRLSQALDALNATLDLVACYQQRFEECIKTIK